MRELLALQPVDYLVVGHIAVDLTAHGNQLGGTAAYAALTARALGLRVGMVTSAGPEAPLQPLDGIQMMLLPSDVSTTFENRKMDNGRKQVLHHRAAGIEFGHIPAVWKSAQIVHLAPIAQELDPELAGQFPGAFIGITPQGWMRAWDEHGCVSPCTWENSEPALHHAGAVVISSDDIRRDLELVERMAHQTRVLCLTEAEAGSVLHWNGDRRRFRPPAMEEVDATGAGDIFAAALFIRMHATRDPWEAARFATSLAAHSVTRSGLNGIPTQKEIEDCLMEVLS